MDSLITAAARALAAGDPLGALKRIALRDDPPALALRGIAMAQLGDLVRAKVLLRRAARGFGPKPLAARRSRTFALTRSPSCAIAMPRSASAGGSSRSAIRFSAPSGSPAASARAAAVISESIEIPTHLSLPPFVGQRLI